MATNYVDKAALTYFATAEKTKMDAKYVAKESGKGLSSVDVTTTMTNKWDAVTDKVDKISGKGLSTNDYTTTEKNKLSGIASGAEVNVQSDWNQTDSTKDDYIKNKPTIPAGVVVDSSMSDSSTNAVQNKVIKKYVDDNVASLYRPKGSITFANLPTTGMKVGDVYNISTEFTTTSSFEEGAGNKYPAGTNIVYDSNSKWDVLAGFVDLSGYVKSSDLVAITNAEIDTIVTGVWG